MIADLPDSVRAALDAGRLAELAVLADGPAPSARDLLGRGVVRMRIGREEQARRDFEQALPELGDACLLQMALLDVHQHRALDRVLETTTAICGRAKPQSAVAAQAWHVRGLVLGKLRQTGESADALLRALRLHRELDDPRGQAEVYDTLGMLYSAEGKLESAVGYFALSLVGKTLGGDRYGMAVTLGNLGRLHLRAGRFEEALSCFRLDLQLASEMGDARGCARMNNDIARVRIGMRDFAGALHDLAACLELAARHGFADVEVFARKDRALALLGLYRAAAGKGHGNGAGTADELLAQAERELDLAQHGLTPGGEPYLALLLRLARGELLLARGDPAAFDLLAQAVRGLAEASLPDLEIPALIALSVAHAERGGKTQAEQCLVRALGRARRDSYTRYLPEIREAFARLDLLEGYVEESGRLDLGGRAEDNVDGYTNLELVGRGAHGEVYRALDPLRNRIVAIKRLRVEELYDHGERILLLTQMRTELEGASLHHPGIARVLAIGRDAEDRTYVVQEFVEGHPLRAAMPVRGATDLRAVLDTVGRIAAALEALHAAGIVHRDLKPENVMLREADRRPVLVDFGIARVPTRPRAFAGYVLGTLSYMAPEQTANKRIDDRADVYALGVVLYEWLAGVRPILLADGAIATAARQVQKKAPVDIREYKPELPPALVELVHRMLDKSPRRRPSAAAVADACRRLAAELQAPG